jgi:anti-sigma regulatory factor (Ser/Thr protein kinase)
MNSRTPGLTLTRNGYREEVPRVDASTRSHDGRNLHMVYDSVFFEAKDLSRLRAETTEALEREDRTRDHVRVVGLLLSELATNALMHASSPYRLTVELDEEETLVNVSDAGDGDAFTRSPAEINGGYGLNLVNALALTWGAEPSGLGKSVWAAVGRNLDI